MKIIRSAVLSTFQNLAHGATTRDGGVSGGLYESLNLSFNSGDNIENVTENRRWLAHHLGIPASRFLLPDQCHTNKVKQVNRQTSVSDLKETDALISNTGGICIGVLAADCVPILLFDPVQNAVGAIHAGLRGTLSKIVQSTILALSNDFKTKAENLYAFIGPCISQKNYEVGLEVVEAINKICTVAGDYLSHTSESGKACVDLRKLNYDFLIQAGVPGENIEVSELCTYDNPNIFFSARRDGFHSGRFASFIMLEQESTS